MKRILPALASLSSLCLLACEGIDPGSGGSRPAASALLECRGKPGYSEDSWKEAVRQFQADPRECGADSGGVTGVVEAREGAETVVIRTVVLDSGCGLLSESRDTVAAPPKAGLRTLFSGRLPDGSLAPTGEYFINTETAWPDGRRDTTWQKVGLLQWRCP